MNPDTPLEQQLRGTLTRTAEGVPDSPRPTLSWERPAGAQVVPLADRRSSRTRRVLQVATPLTIAAAVAAVAVLAGGQGPSGAPTPAAPSVQVEETALLAPGGTVPMAPGQYLYSRTTYQADSTSGRLTVVDEYWVPQDATDVWTYRGTAYDPVTGEPASRYIDPATGAPIQGPRVETAPCGHFDHPEEPCSDGGSWDHPTPRFLASLPTDPAALDALLVEWGENWSRLARGSDEPEQFGSALDEERSKLYDPMYAAGVLAESTVGMSQPFSQALEQAVAALPGVVAKPATNLDGAPGTSYAAVASDGSVVSTEMIFDADGNYIGTPTSTVVVGAADEAGATPAAG